MKCWNSFCIAGDCDGTRHVDATGHSWSQRRGTVYCPACGGYYHAIDACPRGYENPVVTVYDTSDIGGVLGADGNVYSDADPGL